MAKKTTSKAKATAPKTIEEAELQQLRALNNDRNNLVRALGEINYTRLQLDEKEDAIIEQKKTLDQFEVNLVSAIKDKYGDIEVDLDTGQYR